MNKTTVVNKDNSPFDILITRSTIWGNPYIVDKEGREAALREYEKHFLSKPDLIAQLYKLYGKTLGCGCSPLPCHGDFLAKICNSYKVIIAGDRNFKNYEYLAAVCDHYLHNRHGNITIISGCQTGADTLGIAFASQRQYTCLKIPAEWKTGGKAAGPTRNKKMAKIADHCIIFDGGGPGSKSMYNIAEDHGLHITKVNIKDKL